MEQYFGFINHSLTTLGTGNVLALVSLLAVIMLGEAGIAFPFLVQGILLFLGQRIIADPTPQLIPIAVVLIGGRFLGAAGVYWLSRHTGGRMVEWLKKRLPAAGKADQVRSRLGKGKAFLAVVGARLTPGFLVPTSIASGTMRLPYAWFALGVIVSAVAWDAFFVGAGAIAGHNAEQVIARVYSWVAVLMIGLGAVVVAKALVSRALRATALRS
ncbi:MAG: VTT domain-containing protein [Chloroflexi bacterium]|nr:VTT domain-containing protein [Chloroflexota bacterium]